MSSSAPIRHDPDRQRYEYVVDGQAVAFAEYRLDGATVVMHHTYTNPEYRGRGHAARVVEAALDDFRNRGLHVVPQCWFVADFVEAHAEHRDMVANP